MVSAVLDQRALNRATLARQHLLERTPLSPLDAVGRWSASRRRCRATRTSPSGRAWTGSARRNCRCCSRNGRPSAPWRCGRRSTCSRPTTRSRFARSSSRCSTQSSRATPSTGHACATSTSARALATARELLDERPLTTTELRAGLAERHPELDAPAAAYACRCLLALVQVPPRGLWRRSGTVRLTTLEAWVGRALDAAPVARPARPALPRRLRPGDRRRRRDVVAAHRPATRARAAASRSRHVSRRARPRALRPPGRAPARSGDAGAAAVPARVRQRPPVARRPQPVRARRECGRASPASRASGTAGCSTTGSSSASGVSRTARSSCGTPSRWRPTPAARSPPRAGSLLGFLGEDASGVRFVRLR